MQTIDRAIRSTDEVQAAYYEALLALPRIAAALEQLALQSKPMTIQEFWNAFGSEGESE